MFENIKTHQHKLKELENFVHKVILVKEKFSLSKKFNIFEEILISESLNPFETISIGDNFYTDIYPSHLANYQMIFYIQRSNSYVPSIDLKKCFDSHFKNIITISSLDEVKNYIY